MDQNTQLKVEFFELCRRLNKSNLKTNQKTEVSFYIVTEKGRSVLYATTNRDYKIQLILRKNQMNWVSCGVTGLATLEAEIAKLFRLHDAEKLENEVLTRIIKSHIFQLLY